MTNHRRLALLLAVLVGLLAACSASVSADNVRTETERLLTEQGIPFDSVDCPDDLPAEEGSSVECTVDSEGEEFTVSATVTSVEGDTANFDVELVE